MKTEIDEFLRTNRGESREHLVQLNLFLNRLNDEVNRLEHQTTMRSSTQTSRHDLQTELGETRTKISSIIDEENRRFSLQNQCEDLIETIESELDRRPIFSTFLNDETLKNFGKLSEEFYSNLDEHFHRLNSLLKQFKNDGTRAHQRTLHLDQRYEQMKNSHQANLQHLNESFDRQKNRDELISSLNEQLSQCEKQLTDRRTPMRENQLRLVQQEFERLETSIEQVEDQREELEEKRSFSSIKDLQIHSQRVKRLLAETSTHLQTIQRQKRQCDELLEQLTRWFEVDQENFSQTLQMIHELDDASLDSTLVDVQVTNKKTFSSSSQRSLLLFQNKHDALRDGYQMLKSVEQFQQELKPTNSDDENEQLSELISVFHQQLQRSDENFLSSIQTLRQIQLNRTKFNDSSEEIRQTIDEQRHLFEQYLDNQRTIPPDHLDQHIELMTNLEKQLETKTSAMIENLRQTNKTSSSKSNETIDEFFHENQRLKSDIQVRRLFLPFSPFRVSLCRKRFITAKRFETITKNFSDRFVKTKAKRRDWSAIDSIR